MTFFLPDIIWLRPKKVGVLLLSAVLISGCATFDVPETVPTDSDLVATMAETDFTAEALFDETTLTLPDWWNSFDDSVLSDLVQTALKRTVR